MEKTMKIEKRKRIKKFGRAGMALFSALLLATGCSFNLGGLFGGDSSSDDTVVIDFPPYDASTRTPTDEGETYTTVSDEEFEYYNNYIELYDGDGDVYDIGDPYVFRYDGKYYLYTSLNGDKRMSGKIPCWVSENLVDWEWAGWAYDPKSSSANSASYIAFAPEVVYYNGWFYMCESRKGEGHYFFRSASPSGPFELISGNLGMGIDGSFYLANNGQLYFLSAENVRSMRICYFPIDFVEDSSGNVSVSIDNTQTNYVDTAYLNGWTEGPGYFTRNGYGYFTYTGNHVDSASYKVAYSYTSNEDNVVDGLQEKTQNITLVSSGMDNEALPGYASKDGSTQVSNYRGLGHSSNVVGPNLDSIYTAYHNANRVNYNNEMMTSTRKYNVTQYFTNDSYVLTNGLGNYLKTKPATPDYSVNADALVKSGELTLSMEQTESVFTAELSFKLTNNAGGVLAGYDGSKYAKVQVNGTTLTYTAADGSTQTANVRVSTNTEAVHTVKLVNGSNTLDIYYDNVRVLSTAKTISAGKVGYLGGAQPSSTCFTNDAFGTSDFDAVKDLTGSWAAYAYNKGENSGWSIKNASVQADGVRQGEKESTKKVASMDARALVLKANDWVKYTVNAPKSDTYALNLLVGKASRGCVFEVIVDNKTISKMEIPADTNFGDREYINVSAGAFACGEGIHTVKVRVYGGTLDVINFSTESGGAPLGEVTDSLTDSENLSFTAKLGERYSVMPIGIMTSTSDDRALLVGGNQGVGNYEMSIDVRIVSGANGGILFRMDNYSYTHYSTTQLGDTYSGYYLQLNGNFISLTRSNFSKKEQLKVVKPSSEDSFLNGSTVTVTIRCKNGDIKILLNGEEYISVFDGDAYLTGYIGLYNADGSSYVWSNYRYKEI